MISKKNINKMEIEIIYDSDNFIIVNKPPDLLINSNDENQKNTLQHILLKYMAEYKFNNLKHNFHFIHRLDYATSGIICLAKNKLASSSAGKLFEMRKVNKYYLAIVRGLIEKEFNLVNIAIGYDKNYLDSNKKMCIEGINCINSKKALTKILMLEQGYYDNKPATKVLLKPITGRRHQLRLHCQALGHNIIGDYTYSDKKDIDPPRMFLHAYRLILPLENENIDACTQDPFQSSKEKSNGWFTTEIINKIHVNGQFHACVKLDNYSL